jgi:hypothetical protein
VKGLAWEPGHQQVSELCRIVSESAAVTVSSYATGNGMRLQLTSERSGASVLLDATVLDALCSLKPDEAAELVRHRIEDAPSATDGAGQ